MTLINKLLWGVGGLIIVVLIAVGVFFIALHFNKGKQTTQPAGQSQTQNNQINTNNNSNNNQTGNSPVITETDKQALNSIGIDPNKIPKTVTKEMEQCFVEKLGTERIQQFATGKANPTWDDITKIKPCIQQ